MIAKPNTSVAKPAWRFAEPARWSAHLLSSLHLPKPVDPLRRFMARPPLRHLATTTAATAAR
jgi:hypothetical protein